MKKQVLSSVLVLSLGACVANADKLKVDEKQLNNLVQCEGVNTEYSKVDGYYIIPDFGCMYDGKNNKLGNAMIFLITSNANDESIKLKDIKNIKEKYIYLIPINYLVRNENSDILYYQKDKYLYQVFVNNSGKWERKEDIKVNGNKVEVINKISESMSEKSRSLILNNAKVVSKYSYDVNKDGVGDVININQKDGKLYSINIVDGETKKVLYENNEIFDSSFNECSYSKFNNISLSKSNFTLEYTTCSDNSEIGYRYSTFKTEKNKEPTLIQDNYLIYPIGDIPKNYKPKKVNCMTDQTITFSNYVGRCG